MSATVKYYNLTGGLNTIQGIGTINQSTKKTESPDMKNVEYYKLGGLKSMEGNVQFGNQIQDANSNNLSITLGYEYIYGNNKYLIVCTKDGTVWQYDKITTQYKEIYKFPTATNRHSICGFNNGIVISNGVDDLLFYQYGRNENLTGTVTISNGSNIVTGDATTFTTDLSIGDYITFQGYEDKYRVESIESDTSLTLSTNVVINEESVTYYGWIHNSVVYYTKTIDVSSTSVPVYRLVNSVMTEYTTGTITEDGLVISQQEEVTVTKTRTKYTALKGTFTTHILNSSGSDWTSYSYTGYFYYDSTTGTLYSNTQANLGNANRPSESQLTSPYYIYVPLVQQLGGSATDATRSDGNSITSYQEGLPYTIQNTSVGGQGNVYGTVTEDSSYNITETYTTTEEQITEVTYTRDISYDNEYVTPSSNILYYLSNISELNAVYTNSQDENIQIKVRGLALNSYQGRLFVGANDGTLYYSEVGLIHGWDLQYGAGAIPTFYNDNSDFTALGVFEKYLVICKREQSYILDGTDSDDAQWTIQPHSEFTCDSQQSWLVANNSFLVYSRTGGGIYPLLSRTIYNSNYQGNEISVKIRDSFEYVNQAKMDYIFPVYSPRKKYVMFYIPTLTGLGSNYCYIFDLQSKTWLLRVVPQEVTCAFRFDNEIYIGTKDGKILKEFQGLTFDGQPIEWYWKSPWFSYGEGSNFLSAREFRINIAEESTNRFYVRNRRDGIDTAKQRYVTNNLNSFSGLVWDIDTEGETITDTVWDEDSWVSIKHIVKRFPLPNQFFQTIQIEFYGNATDEGMSIYGFELDGIQLEEVPY